MEEASSEDAAASAPPLKGYCNGCDVTWLLDDLFWLGEGAHRDAIQARRSATTLTLTIERSPSFFWGQFCCLAVFCMTIPIGPFMLCKWSRRFERIAFKEDRSCVLFWRNVCCAPSPAHTHTQDDAATKVVLHTGANSGGHGIISLASGRAIEVRPSVASQVADFCGLPLSSEYCHCDRYNGSGD